MIKVLLWATGVIMSISSVAAAQPIKISQVYGCGKHRSDSQFATTSSCLMLVAAGQYCGWSLQYAAGDRNDLVTHGSSSRDDPAGGSSPRADDAHRGGRMPLPTPDHTVSTAIAMAATAGKGSCREQHHNTDRLVSIGSDHR